MAETSFKDYGTHFQEIVMHALLIDQKWARQMVEVLDTSYFELKNIEYLAQRYFDYAKKYKVFPTLQMLAHIVRDELSNTKDTALREQVIAYMDKVYEGEAMNDLPYVKEKSLDFCKQQALLKAMERAITAMQQGNYEMIVGDIKKALSVGTCVSAGHELNVDYESRYTPEQRRAVSTGYEPIDAITRGGLGDGELGYIIAPTGVGKSHMMVDMGASAQQRGLNVLHFALEMKEEEVALRYDSRQLGINSQDLLVSKVSEVASQVSKVKGLYAKKPGMGRLFIKEFSPKVATVNTLMTHIEHLQCVKNFKPDVIFVDYLDLMRSTRALDQPRMELELISQELIALGRDLGIPVWTATQSNKEGVRADIIDTSNMAEGFSKAFGASLVIALMRKPHEKSAGIAKIFVAKNRMGPDGLLYFAKFDGAQSRITIEGNALSQEQQVSASNTDGAKSASDTFKKLRASKDNKEASKKWNALEKGQSGLSLEKPKIAAVQ
jgi:replicative DNA helicase